MSMIRLRELEDVEKLAKSLEGYATAFDTLHRDIASDFRMAAELVRLPPEWPHDAYFKLGDTVHKKSGSMWHGTIVGWYRTKLTPLGYAVESYYEEGSVQIYPESALRAWEPEPA